MVNHSKIPLLWFTHNILRSLVKHIVDSYDICVIFTLEKCVEAHGHHIYYVYSEYGCRTVLKYHKVSHNIG